MVYGTAAGVGIAATVAQGISSAAKSFKQVANGKSLSNFEKYFDKNAKNSLWTKADDVVDSTVECTGGIKASAGGKGIEDGLGSTDDIIRGVEKGDISLTNNIQKGNYGEMKMDSYFKSQGYE